MSRVVRVASARAHPYVAALPRAATADNTAVIALYERLGFRRILTSSYGSRLLGRTP
ncbi:hypothetical protein ACQEVB_10400 [Pseudonocardia sp. CA-107938]|uniref:hypothetical protein n=1 Tax=Pseudonocardia sp. CA-107938 TaxID=3240021 RepID=UPI003D91C644